MTNNNSLGLSDEWSRRRTAAIPNCIVPLHDVMPTSGNGCIVIDTDGRRLIDLTGGLGVLALGYGHPTIVKAIQEQAARLTHTSFPTMPSAPYIELAEQLVEMVGPGHKVTFFNSGAEAVENAAKVCRWATGRSEFINLESAFHGRTWASLALTYDEAPFKNRLGDLGIKVHSLPRDMWAGMRHLEQALPDCVDEVDVARNLVALEKHAAASFNPSAIAGMFIEPVLGNSGAVAVSPAFIEAASRFCRRHGILLICDEIQCGIGRIGAWFTANGYGVKPDIIVTGKALGGGLPLSALIGRAEVLDSLHRGALGGTTGGNPVACAAGSAVLSVIRHEGLLLRAGVMARIARRILSPLEQMQAHIQVRTIGTMIAVEFQHDNQLAGQAGILADATFARARAEGLLLLRGGGKSKFVRILPPLVMDDGMFEESLDRLASIVRDVVERVSVAGPVGE